MTNPDNAIGTNGAYGGRTSVNAANDILGLFQSRGVLSGWAATPNTGLTISLGGDGSTRDVAIAEDNAGNKTTINNISQDPVDVTIPAAPASNSRIDLVVAYVDNPPQGQSTDLDNFGACGLIVVSGVPASTPVAPTDANIRSAITADGATGAQAYYVVLTEVVIETGTTTLTSDNLSIGSVAEIQSPTATIVQDLGYYLLMRLVRVGNIVTALCPPQINSTIPQSMAENEVEQKIAEGFRPSEQIEIPIPAITGRVGSAGLVLKPDGSISWFSSFSNSGTWRISASASWLTDDDFPKDELL